MKRLSSRITLVSRSFRSLIKYTELQKQGDSEMSVEITKWDHDLKDVGKRDAVHAPVIVAFCTKKLKAGESVRFLDNKCTAVEKCYAELRHGVVSPFLESDAPAETAVAIFLRPESTSNLRHHYDVAFAGKEEPEDDKDERIKQLEDEINGLKEDLELAREMDEDDGCLGCY